MIISLHLVAFANFHYTDYKITPLIIANKLWTQFMAVGGGLGDDIFVLISGYFLINSRGIKINKIIDLYVRTLFYSITIFVVFACAGTAEVNRENILMALVPFKIGEFWFIHIYIVLYLIHPWLNMFLRALSCDDYKKFLKAIFLYWSIIPSFTTLHFGGSPLVNFICLYSLAAYIRLWADDFGSKKFIGYGFLFIALNFICVMIFNVLALKIEFLRGNVGYFYDVMWPLTILASLCFLIGFKHLEIKYNPIINVCGAATFGVYLLHVHRFFSRFVFRRLAKFSLFHTSPYLIPYIIFVWIAVYIFCTAFEIMRSTIFKILSRGRLS